MEREEKVRVSVMFLGGGERSNCDLTYILLRGAMSNFDTSHNLVDGRS